jgi:hypothetical protein
VRRLIDTALRAAILPVLAVTGGSLTDLLRDKPQRDRSYVILGRERNDVRARPGTEAGLPTVNWPRTDQPGIYPYVCTFPGHWVVMNGEMIVAKDLADVDSMLAARQPTIVKEWTLDDFPDVKTSKEETTLTRGMTAFVKSRCNQCHVVAGHGVAIGA